MAATGWPGVADPRSVRLGRVVALLLLLVALASAVLLPPLLLEATSISVSLVAALVCFVVAWRRGRSRPGRPAWAGLGTLLALWAVADVLWALIDLGVLVGHDALADVFYLAGIPPAVAGMLRLADVQWERGESVRVLVDVLVLAVPLLLVGDVLVMRQLTDEGLTTTTGYLVMWPVIGVLITCLAFVLSRRTIGRSRTDLALVVLAFAVWTVGDTWLAYLALSGQEYFGSLAQLPFLIGPVLLALAALVSGETVRAQDAEGVLRHATRRTVVLLPTFVVMTAGVICLATGVQEAHEWFLVGLGAALAVMRQGMVAVDADELRESLECRVAERTERLQVVSERLELILDSIGEGIVGVEADGRIGFANSAAAELLGARVKDLLGRSACEVMCGARHAECPLRLVATLGHRLDQAETVFQRADGSRFPVETTATPVRSEVLGSALGSVVAFRDIAERHAMEQVKQQFVSSVSHELRTPLTAIRGALEMLADGDGGVLPTGADGLVRTAERGVVRLGRLVDDILDVERLASGRFSVTPRPVAVGPLLVSVTEMLSGWAAQQQVELRTGRLEGIAMADPDRIEQAMFNLLGNAVKFSPPGAVVHLSAVSRGGEVLVEVRDQGRGIPEQDLPHVFERFHQVAEGDATEKGGTGLGLTITRSIVQRHGGEIWVESRWGSGATFRFTLPSPAPQEDPALRDHPVEALGGG